MRVLVRLVPVLIVALATIPIDAANPSTHRGKLSQMSLDESKLGVHFIDMGAGLAMLIETSGGRMHTFVDGATRACRTSETTCSGSCD